MRSSFLVNEYSRLVSKLKNADWFGIYWAFFIVFLPIYHPVNTFKMSSRDYQAGLFYLVCATSLAIFQRNTCKNSNLQNAKIAAGLFLGLLVFNWKYITDSIAFFHILGVALTIAMIFQFSQRWHRSMTLIRWGFAITLIVQFLWIGSQYMGYQPSWLWGSMRKAMGCADHLSCPIPVCGSLENTMVTATYLAPVLTMATPAIGLFAFLPLLISLFILKSAIAWFAILSVFVFTICKACHHAYDKKKIFIWLGVLFPVGVISVTPYLARFYPFLDDSTRYNAWVSIFKNVGFTAFGKGAGWFFHNGRKAVDPALKFYQEHNEFIALYVAAGFVGVLLAIWFMVEVLKNWKSDHLATCTILATFCVSYGAFPFHISSSALTFAVACGALLSYSYENSNRAKF